MCPHLLECPCYLSGFLLPKERETAGRLMAGPWDLPAWHRHRACPTSSAVLGATAAWLVHGEPLRIHN